MTDEVLGAIATARAFTLAAEAQSTVLILERPGREATLIEVDELLDAEVTEGEDVASVPSSAVLDQPSKPLPEVRPTPPSAISIDVHSGELSAPLGAIEHLADAVLALATAFGGRTVASVEFATSDPDTPITFAARAGERVVLAAGEEQFEL